jgi:hypothetical protein
MVWTCPIPTINGKCFTYVYINIESGYEAYPQWQHPLHGPHHHHDRAPLQVHRRGLERLGEPYVDKEEKIQEQTAAINCCRLWLKVKQADRNVGINTCSTSELS